MQQDMQNCKQHSQKLNANIEVLQKSVTKNEHMLAAQRIIVDELMNKTSQLLTNTRLVVFFIGYFLWSNILLFASIVSIYDKSIGTETPSSLL